MDVDLKDLLILNITPFFFCFVFRSIKHYFLLDQGDFFVHFLDLAETELQKPSKGYQKKKNKVFKLC